MKKILVIDDESEMLESLQKILSHRSEYELTLLQDPLKALEIVRQKKFDLIITDLKMKEASGIDILKAALIKFSDSQVIVISGYGTIEASVEAMREGAFDFIEKPFTSRKLFQCIDRVFESSVKETKLHDEKSEDLLGIIYESTEMANLVKDVKKVASGNMNLLITGESGVGKELVARAIHHLSRGNLNPFVPVNCGALPEHLFESELFGHEKGAFTGAIKTKPGLLEFANNGTFFFDEIGDMSLALQVKILRMLEERKIRRVGGQKELNIDVRIIAATNKDLERAVQEKNFREDLYYRLTTIQLEVPPLRERVADIIPLGTNYLKELSSKNEKIVNRFSPEAEEALKAYSWPGNVRELQNMIARAYYLCAADIIQRGDLPIPSAEKLEYWDVDLMDLSYKDAKDALLEKFEIEYLTYYLKKNKGNISKTADNCGLDRRSIHRLINKYNIVYKE